jgi:hypothetical protein
LYAGKTGTLFTGESAHAANEKSAKPHATIHLFLYCMALAFYI